MEGSVGSGSKSGLGSSLLSAGIGLVNGFLQRDFERREASLQREWSESMADKQNAWNLDMWQRETDYNSPVNQVQRLRDAGLNPLFYGLDGNAAATAQSAATPLGYERARSGMYSNPVVDALDVAMRVAQIDNVRASTAKTNNENVSETVRRQEMQQNIQNMKDALKTASAERDLTDAQRRNVEKVTSWLDRLNQASLESQESATRLNDSVRNRIDKLLAGELKLQIKSLEDFNRKWKMLDEQIGQIAVQTGILRKDLENYTLNHMSEGFENSGLSVSNILRLLSDATDSESWFGDLATRVSELLSPPSDQPIAPSGTVVKTRGSSKKSKRPSGGSR